MFFRNKKNTVPWEETAIGRKINESAEESYRIREERRMEYERLCNPERLEVMKTAWPVFVFFFVLHIVFVFLGFLVFRPLFIFCGVSFFLFLIFYFFPPFWKESRYLFLMIVLSWLFAAAVFFMSFLFFDMGLGTRPVHQYSGKEDVSVTEDSSPDEYEDFLREVYGDDSFLQAERSSVEEGL